jgi:TDG/mug DNA glycosylase family protein
MTLREKVMAILPDYLGPGLTVVFCGTAAGLKSAARGHYYAGPGNEFWAFVSQAGFASNELKADDDYRCNEFGFGLTDLAKHVAATSDAGLKKEYDVGAFLEKMRRFRPQWIAFHGKEAATAVARHEKVRGKIKLGRQSWNVGSSSVFVLPSASGANRDAKKLEGKSNRLEWFKELFDLSSKTAVP